MIFNFLSERKERSTYEKRITCLWCKKADAEVHSSYCYPCMETVSGIQMFGMVLWFILFFGGTALALFLLGVKV